MATIGSALTAPETGWERYDETDSNISYIGTWSNLAVANLYNGNSKYNYVPENKSIRFNFIGSKIRIIQFKNNSSSDYNIKIDGIDYGSVNILNSTTIYQILTFEKTGLSYKEHCVDLYGESTNKFNLDAIDIDDTGELKPYNEDIFHPMYLINQGADYYYINNNYLKLGAPINNSELNDWFTNYGYNDIGILINPLTTKKVPTTVDDTSTYKSLDIDLNDITGSNIVLAEEGAKKLIQYDCNSYKIIDKIKLNNGSKFDVVMKEV